MDVVANNPPECEALYNQSRALIEDLDSYDLYRTVYKDGNGATSLKKKFISRQRKGSKGLVYDMPTYVNRQDVRKALNIPTSI